MKDIQLNTAFKKVQYVIAWFGFIFFGLIILWVIALYFAQYKDYGIKSKKGILNKSYEKLIFWYGSITADTLIIGTLIYPLIALIFRL